MGWVEGVHDGGAARPHQLAHVRHSREAGVASLVKGMLGGCLALSCSLGLNSTSLSLTVSATTAGCAAAIAGLIAADIVVLATNLVVQQLAGCGLMRCG